MNLHDHIRKVFYMIINSHDYDFLLQVGFEPINLNVISWALGSCHIGAAVGAGANAEVGAGALHFRNLEARVLQSEKPKSGREEDKIPEK